MLVFRIAPRKHNNQNNALSGTGGLFAEGRWHFQGSPIVYTASTRSLAMLERLVNDSTDILSTQLSLTEIHIPDNIKIVRYSETELEDGWEYTPYSQYSQKIGSDWLKSHDSAVLQVPSSVCLNEYNFLINPEHKDTEKIRCIHCQPFGYPARLAAKLPPETAK